MARRKYKKTKRKLSRKVIHKTRRRTKNRVKKISKNQSGGMILLNQKLTTNIKNDNAAVASASKKRGRSSESAAASTKRAKPTSLFDEELGKLIINELFGNVTNVSFIQDNSLYAYILYGTVPTGTILDTKYLSLREALDTYNTDRGIPLQHFCMKLSLDHSIPTADRFESCYIYVDSKNDTHSKRAVSVMRSTKEAHLQKKLYDSFACMRGTSPFVPDVIAHGVFNHEQFESYISLFKSNRLAAATETGTATEIERRVLHVLTEINTWLQQKNIEDGRKNDASKKQNWAVDILLMEYIDKTEYPTLNALGTTHTWGKPISIETALLTSAAQLACATGVKIILYDCHKDNILSNKTQTRVVLIDIGDAIDLNNKCDKQFILQTFGTMLGILSVENPYCSIEQLRAFFRVDITAATSNPDKKVKKGKQEPNILTQKLEENLDNLVDFRCVQLTIEDIHHNLIMTAFVDFVMYIVAHKGNQCQSRYTMESVYGAGTFSNFSTFLTTFRSSGPPPGSYRAKLVIVGTEISKIVRLCSSVNCAIETNRLGSILTSSAALPSETIPPELLEGQPPPPAAEEQAESRQSRCAIM